jgi:ligand-binding SRPBCC domain-containing protein
MADHVLERRVFIPRARPDVFGFFADPRNLALVNPPGMRLAWLAPPPDVLAAGSVLDFSVRLLGVPVRWRVMIREFDPPYRFVDVQLWGPFSRWEHRHRFAEGAAPDGTGGAGTWVEDRLTYRLPLGALGSLAHAVAAGRSIAAMFDYRARRLVELLGGGAGPRPERAAT